MLAPAESTPWVNEAILSICAKNERIDHRNATRSTHKSQPTERPYIESPRGISPNNPPYLRQLRDLPTDQLKLRNQFERRSLGNLATTLRQRLTMRLSDAGFRRHQTKLIYPEHRLPPRLIEDTTPPSREPIVRPQVLFKTTPPQRRSHRLHLGMVANRSGLGILRLRLTRPPKVLRPQWSTQTPTAQ